jgi:hypothetical protein
LQRALVLARKAPALRRQLATAGAGNRLRGSGPHDA